MTPSLGLYRGAERFGKTGGPYIAQEVGGRSYRSVERVLHSSREVQEDLGDGINANNAQPDFIPSCENLIGINLIE